MTREEFIEEVNRFAARAKASKPAPGARTEDFWAWMSWRVGLVEDFIDGGSLTPYNWLFQDSCSRTHQIDAGLNA